MMATRKAGNDVPPKTMNRGILSLVRLKRKCREIFHRVEEAKRRVTKAKMSTDAKMLQLQNLNYEKGHLEREIERNVSFETTEMNKIKFDDAAFAATAEVFAIPCGAGAAGHFDCALG